MPVTFVSRIKSSGYGQASGTMQGLGGMAGKGRGGRPRARSLSGCKSTAAPRIAAYPVSDSADAMTNLQSQYRLPPAIASPPVLALAYSPDAKYLAIVVAGSDYRTLPCLRTPLIKYNGEGFTFLGHTTRLSSVCFSNDSSLILAAGEKQAFMWRTVRTDGPALIISSWRPPTKSVEVVPARGKGLIKRPGSATNRGNKNDKTQEFPGRVSSAQFFFLDKFVVLVMRGHVIMYSYAPGGVAAEDLSQRGPAAGARYRQVHMWDCMPSTCSSSATSSTTVTAMTCMNSIQSSLLLSATSDRRILVLDAVSGTVARDISSQHSRSVHSLALPSPSPHTAVSSSSCQVFASAAADGIVALWDVRAPRCVWRYNGHVNRTEPVAVALSPCLRLLSVGSEDGAPRTVDLRLGRELYKHSAHREACVALQYNPMSPQLTCGSYDGELRQYTVD